MAQAGWFLYQRWDSVVIGVFSSEANAKAAAVDGEYVLVPIEANQSYLGIDESLPGAIIYQADGFDTRLTTVEDQTAQLLVDLDATRTQAQTKFNQVDARLDGLDTSIVDLEARVEALETP